MLKISPDEIKSWRIEIEQAERFRDKELGVYNSAKKSGVGLNLEYFEKGWENITNSDQIPTLNIVFPVVKNIIPSLYYKNPKILAFPKRNQDEDSAPYAAEILNYYHRELNLKEVNQKVVFDAYLCGLGICKIGYATQFGADIPDEKLEKERDKRKEKGLLEILGLRKPKPVETSENIEQSEYIRAENPYAIWVSPFDFLIDPRANSIDTAQWVAQRVRKTLRQVKDNPNYSNTKELKSSESKDDFPKDITQHELEKFQTIDLYEIHYKTDKGISILTLAKDQEDYRALRHEESVYEIDGFQFEILTLNKHGHKLYPISDITLIRPLQDRINDTFDAILDQVDKFVSKIFYDENALTAQGKLSLRDGLLGSLVACTKSPADVAKEFSMIQVKADMVALVEKTIDMISLMTGLTRAQLTGLTSAETATEAQIGQSGQNLRRSEQADAVTDYINRVDRKFWQVVSQFVDLEELQLITGEPLMSQDGIVKYNWVTIDTNIKDKLIKGEYSFDIEVGSAQRPNIEVIRQQALNGTNMLFNPIVKQLLAQEGTNLNLTEVLRTTMKLFPEWIKNTERILQQATPQQQQMAMMPPQQPSNRGQSPENTGATPNMPRTPPTPTSMTEEIFGERRGGI